jgi:hypothetical protein
MHLSIHINSGRVHKQQKNFQVPIKKMANLLRTRLINGSSRGLGVRGLITRAHMPVTNGTTMLFRRVIVGTGVVGGVLAHRFAGTGKVGALSEPLPARHVVTLPVGPKKRVVQARTEPELDWMWVWVRHRRCVEPVFRGTRRSTRAACCSTLRYCQHTSRAAGSLN